MRDYSINGQYSEFGARASYGEFHQVGWASISQINSAVQYPVGSYIIQTNDGQQQGGYNRGTSVAYVIPEKNLSWFIVGCTYDTQYRYRDRMFNDNTTPPPPVQRYIVTFNDWDGRILKRETVDEGKAATAPVSPSRDGFTFIGWDKPFTVITADTTVTARYEQNPSTDIFFKPTIDGFSFANSSYDLGFSPDYRTPLHLWIDVYGPTIGTAYYNQFGQELWGGSCWGFSVISTKFYNGNLNSANYGGYNTFDIPAPRSSTHRLTELIERAQINWHLPGVSSVTYGNNALISASERFASTGQEPIILYIDGMAGPYSYVHAVVPWKVERVDGITRIYVYDNNHPGVENIYYLINSSGGFSASYTYAGYPISILRLGYVRLQQVLNGEARHVPRSEVLISVDTENAQILTANGMSVEMLNGANKVDAMPSIAENTGFTTYRLPAGEYTVRTHTEESVSVLVTDGSNAFAVNVMPERGRVELEVGDVLEITAAVHGNITEYAEDGSAFIIPITAAKRNPIPGAGQDRTRFSDVRSGDWFEQAVTSISYSGIIQGVGNNRFNPIGRLTVAELVTMLMRTQIGEIRGNGVWYAPYIEKAMADGILNASDNLNPTASITRAQAALIITRYVEAYNPLWAQTRIDSTPSDISAIPNEYVSSVANAFRWGIFRGDDQGNFNPHNTLTRAEAAQIIYNYFSVVK